MDLTQMPDIGPVMPEILLTCGALVVLMVDLFIKDKAKVAMLTLGAALVTLYYLMYTSGSTFGGMFVADPYSIFFKLIFLVNLCFGVLISIRYLEVEQEHHGEYYALMMFATVGMMIMASAADLIQLYVGLELMALSTYVLAGFLRRDTRSNEASLKYLLLGAFASGFLLYGISLVYGMTGTTNLAAIAAAVQAKGIASDPGMLLGIIFMVVAFAFKVAAAPFHMWAPDVYEGAPTSVTAFMSVGPKAAGFAAFGRVFLVGFANSQVEWSHVLVPIAVLTMAVGNLVALAQTNIKRMLAYSSIAHAGYALTGVIAGGTAGVAGMMNYLMIYAFMNIGAFAIVILLRTDGFRGDQISDFEGMARTHPLPAALMLVFMFSLTGIPPTAGFMGKFYLFSAAVDAGYTWLVIVAVMFSAISAYYYLRIVMYMYMREPQTEVRLSTAPGINLAIALSLAAVIVIGVLPDNLLNLAHTAASWSGM